ncbi:MAG: hypothetical protein IBX64_12915 [Actinobacteria bacterium]|nr:hypothetical protein [Actinomycetota bacterium]
MRGQGFTLSEYDRQDLVDNILSGNKQVAKAVENVIAGWLATCRRVDSKQTRDRKRHTVIEKARQLKEALDALDRGHEITFICSGIKLGTLKQEVEALAAFGLEKPARGCPIDNKRFDLLVTALKAVLIDNGFTISGHRDNVLNRTVDFALRVTGNERADSLNQIRAYLKRHEDPGQLEAFSRTYKEVQCLIKTPEHRENFNKLLKQYDQELARLNKTT